MKMPAVPFRGDFIFELSRILVRMAGMSYFWSVQDFICPYCNQEVGLPVSRWDTKEKCPLCSQLILIEFDFVVMDDGDEWDIYNAAKAPFEHHESPIKKSTS